MDVCVQQQHDSVTRRDSKRAKPSRRVTRTCSCGQTFKPKRRDARFCSGRCRQRAVRASRQGTDIDREIEQHRLAYWDAIRRKAEAKRISMAQVLTGQSQRVEDDGRVFMGGSGMMGGMGPDAKHVGTLPNGIRKGWTGWGLEAAGPPYTPPMCDTLKERAASKARRKAARKAAAGDVQAMAEKLAASAEAAAAKLGTDVLLCVAVDEAVTAEAA